MLIKTGGGGYGGGGYGGGGYQVNVFYSNWNLIFLYNLLNFVKTCLK